ncbi:MAG: hypothetical protein ACI9PY_000267 [Ascidiaceihabitans sp.]|jgi:hypothetical protein
MTKGRSRWPCPEIRLLDLGGIADVVNPLYALLPVSSLQKGRNGTSHAVLLVYSIGCEADL